jgi:Glucose / Sorbosone dehydrogenase
VRIIKDRRLLMRACVNLGVNAQGERGTLGIALHPKFDRNNLLYVYYTNASPLENRVTRFKVSKNRCTRPVTSCAACRRDRSPTTGVSSSSCEATSSYPLAMVAVPQERRISGAGRARSFVTRPTVPFRAVIPSLGVADAVRCGVTATATPSA